MRSARWAPRLSASALAEEGATTTISIPRTPLTPTLERAIQSEGPAGAAWVRREGRVRAAACSSACASVTLYVTEKGEAGPASTSRTVTPLSRRS